MQITTPADAPRVAVCFPSSELVNANFVLSLIGSLVRNTIPIATVANVQSSRIAFNRNMLVDKAYEARATHILFIDADMVFPADALKQLLSYDLDIVGVTAARRKEGDDGAIGETLDGSRLYVPSPPRKMRLLGLPFMLIKMSVFSRLRKPWFAEPPRFMMGDALSHDLMPEDEYFCHTAIEAGFDVWCDINLSMQMGHRGHQTFTIMKPTLD